MLSEKHTKATSRVGFALAVDSMLDQQVVDCATKRIAIVASQSRSESKLRVLLKCEYGAHSGENEGNRGGNCSTCCP